MYALNLLSHEHLQYHTQALGRRRRLRLWLVGAAVACLWMIVLGLQLMQQQAMIREAQIELAQWQNKATEHQRLVAQRDTLQTKLAMVKQLRDPIAPAAMLALLTQMLPPQAVLQSLVIHVPPPALPQALQAQSRDGLRKKTAAASPAEWPVMLVQLEGLVTHTYTPARVAGELARSKVLAHVRIEQSQQVVIQDQLLHQFRLNIEIPLPANRSPQPARKVATR